MLRSKARWEEFRFTATQVVAFRVAGPVRLQVLLGTLAFGTMIDSGQAAILHDGTTGDHDSASVPSIPGKHQAPDGIIHRAKAWVREVEDSQISLRAWGEPAQVRTA
jgi:hypothetical protein